MDGSAAFPVPQAGKTNVKCAQRRNSTATPIVKTIDIQLLLLLRRTPMCVTSPRKAVAIRPILLLNARLGSRQRLLQLLRLAASQRELAAMSARGPPIPIAVALNDFIDEAVGLAAASIPWPKGQRVRRQGRR